ncbi:hypothetical protein HOLleu_18936 [Holothuria leucospilota]|uniref:Uncharacterized protein n=1 Tax=Holothuria leucospilota TaxID=206669 RepID=A0A9Q1HA98_HOLLE|nr:hypothetical protein HOLleu_18936 [Holothuria leucospilota]
MGEQGSRCVQYFGIYFIITGVAVISIGASETRSLITTFTYSGLSFISCGAFLLLAHSSIKRGTRRSVSHQRTSDVYHTGQDVTVSLEVNLETVRDYLSVSKRSGNAVIVNIDDGGNLTCELTAEDNVDPALSTACSIPDMDVNSLELHAQQQQALQKVLRLVRRTSGRHHYEHGKVCTFDDGTISVYIWHGFNSSDGTGNRRTTDPPPVYADVICIPPIREEEPPSYQDVIVTMESAL